MKITMLILSLVFVCNTAVFGQRAKFKGMERLNPDTDMDLKVDATELKYWSSNIVYSYNSGNGEEKFGERLYTYIRSFDENHDGKLSSLESRRFQAGAKKLFADAYDLIATKFDDNKNSRLDKEERIAASTEVKDILTFAFNIKEVKKAGEDAEVVLERRRALDDIYD